MSEENEDTVVITSEVRAKLRSFVSRLEVLEENKQALLEDIREVYTEAKLDGFDVKILRQVVRLLRRDKDDVEMESELLDTYMGALDV
jgi:uncharacterized protein (UPF0335 family)